MIRIFKLDVEQTDSMEHNCTSKLNFKIVFNLTKMYTSHVFECKQEKVNIL